MAATDTLADRVVRHWLRPLAVGIALLSGGCSGTAAEAPTPADAEAFNLVNRLTWGATAADLADFRRQGRQAWVDAQLRPSPVPALPAEARALIAAQSLDSRPMGAAVVELEAMRIASTREKDPTRRVELRTQYGAALKEAGRQALERSILRDLTSPDQLREQMTWFWFNHFNVRSGVGNLAAMITDYEERTIRPRALGKFCDLVGATLRHPAMLLYLNNAQSKADKINENYARELMELHTMGVGSGYTQKDVQQLARVLTGATVDMTQWPAPPPPPGGIRDGLFVYDPARHDNGSKVLLGQKLKARGYAEIDEATGILCRQPATAKRISTRIAQYMVADTPPPELVDAMAATFTRSDGDIGAVLRTMIDAPAFKASLGTLYKDPTHYVLSAARLAASGQPIVNTVPLGNMFNLQGQGRFGRLTPDGYPLEAANWNASGQLEMRFGIARQIGGGMKALFDGAAAVPDLKGLRERDGIYPMLAPATVAALAETKNDREWNALFLSSPEFMRR